MPCEILPVFLASLIRRLAERLDRKQYPIMAELTAKATFDNDQGDVAPMVWFGLRRLLDGIDAYAPNATT